MSLHALASSAGAVRHLRLVIAQKSKQLRCTDLWCADGGRTINSAVVKAPCRTAATMHSARNAYATLTLCALTLGFAPRPRVSRCTQLRLSPDRDELRKLRVKELQAELGKRNIRWQSFLEKEELVVALSEALEAAENFSGSGAMTPGLVADSA